MNCQQAQASFAPRLDGRLDPAENAAFEAHLGNCPSCAAEWRAYAGAWTLIGRQTVPEVSVGFVERTLRRLDEAPAAWAGRWWIPLWRWGVVGALALTLAAAGWFGWQAKRSRQLDAQAELYVMVHQDRLEDFDVVAALHLLDTDSP